MGVGKSTYFTEFVIFPDESTASESWVIGDLVYGEETGTIGVLEEGSTDGILVVSNVIGGFRPGETVYQTAKSARILRTGEVNGFAFIDGTADLSTVTNIRILCLGKETILTEPEHFTISAENSVLINEAGRDKLRRFPFVLASEDNTVLEYRATARDSGNAVVAEGYAVVPTLKITNTITKTKSFFSELDPGSIDQYTSDVSIRNKNEGDLIEIADGATFRGNKDSNVLICESVSADASSQLVSGDIIVFTDDDDVT